MRALFAFFLSFLVHSRMKEGSLLRNGSRLFAGSSGSKRVSMIMTSSSLMWLGNCGGKICPLIESSSSSSMSVNGEPGKGEEGIVGWEELGEEDGGASRKRFIRDKEYGMSWLLGQAVSSRGVRQQAQALSHLERTTVLQSV
jgi:hypothetical protein